MSLADVLDQADTSVFMAAAAAAKLGTVISGQGTGLRLVKESVPVASNAATPSYAVVRLVRANVSGGSAGNGEKLPTVNGRTGVQTVRETGLVVATNATATAWPVEVVRAASKTVSSTRTRLTPIANHATLAAGQVRGVDSSAFGTKALAFYAADVADGATIDVIYDTFGGVAVPASDGSSVAFYAGEVTGASAVVELEYLTTDAPKGATSLAGTATGIW